MKVKLWIILIINRVINYLLIYLIIYHIEMFLLTIKLNGLIIGNWITPIIIWK